MWQTDLNRCSYIQMFTLNLMLTAHHRNLWSKTHPNTHNYIFSFSAVPPLDFFSKWTFKQLVTVASFYSKSHTFQKRENNPLITNINNLGLGLCPIVFCTLHVASARMHFSQLSRQSRVAQRTPTSACSSRLGHTPKKLRNSHSSGWSTRSASRLWCESTKLVAASLKRRPDPLPAR